MSYLNDKTDPRSSSFGQDTTDDAVRRAAEEWKAKAYRTDNLPKPTNAPPQAWDDFMKVAKS